MCKKDLCSLETYKQTMLNVQKSDHLKKLCYTHRIPYWAMASKESHRRTPLTENASYELAIK